MSTFSALVRISMSGRVELQCKDAEEFCWKIEEMHEDVMNQIGCDAEYECDDLRQDGKQIDVPDGFDFVW